MEWLKSAESIMNSSAFSNLAGSLLGNNKKPAAPPSVPTPVITVQNPVASEGMKSSTVMMIVGGVVALVAVLFIAIKK